MNALILMPSHDNPGFLEVHESITCTDEDEFLTTLESYESKGYTIWLTEIVA
tara:strand:- start:684 stop:839 length:156 start_codon:yes stop_codon:yes gene_type:complete